MANGFSRVAFRSCLFAGVVACFAASPARAQKHVVMAGPPEIVGAAIVADKTEVEEGEWVRLRVEGASTTFEPIRVEWSRAGGRIVRPHLFLDRTAVLDTTGLAPGEHTITAELVAVPSLTSATCAVAVTVLARSDAGPETIRTDKGRFVSAGEILTLTTDLGTPDDAKGSRLAWSATGGRISPNGREAALDTTDADG